VARAAVAGDEVIAAGIFRMAGSLTARMAGFGEFSVRRLEREMRTSSGLAFKRYLLLVVTPGQLHLFDARSKLTRWKAERLIAVWQRSAVQATKDLRSMTTRLTLEIPAENRRLELEAPKSRASTAGEVARVLAGTSAPARPDVRAPIHPEPQLADGEQARRRRKDHDRAGWLGVTGGAIRLLAYAMPWMVATSATTGRTADVSGYRILGEPVFSVVYAIAIIVTGVFYLAGRRDGSPRLLLSLGIGSIAAFVIQYWIAIDRIGSTRTALQARGLSVSVSSGFGIWVELAGALLAAAGGLLAHRLWSRSRPRPGSYAPPIPSGTEPLPAGP